jgi:hypothetical protein
MKTRNIGEENLYDAEADMLYHEQKLAVISYLVGFDPSDIDSMRIDYAVVKLRKLWNYSSDVRGDITGATFSSNKIHTFLSKQNVVLTEGARYAYWNYCLARGVKNGQ